MAQLIDETLQQLEDQAKDLREAIRRVEQASMMQKSGLAVKAIEEACDLLDVIVADRGNMWRRVENMDMQNRITNERLTGLERINGIL